MAEPSAALTSWLQRQMPSVQKKVKAIQLDKGESVLHVGPGLVRNFYPRIPGSVAPGEDTTVGRVCCSLTLSQALWGGRHHFPAPRMYLYSFEERNVLVPSVELTQEGKRGNEVWIVPHRMENWNIKPTRVGEVRLLSKSHDVEGTDRGVMAYVAFITDQPVPFDKSNTMEVGKCYEFQVDATAKWTPVNGGDDVEYHRDAAIKFIGEVDKEFWDRAAFEYTVTVK